MIELQEHPCLVTWPEKRPKHHGSMMTGMAHYCRLDDGIHDKHFCPCGAVLDALRDAKPDGDT